MSRRLNGFNAPQWLRWIVLVLLALAAFMGRDWLGADATTSSSAEAGGDVTIQRLFENRTSGEIVSIHGIVDRVLEDDNTGSRHQRFIVRLESRSTVLIAHNSDLAERVPLAAGDEVVVRGEYEWNDRGGLLHWTHHDPAGRHPGGWVEHEGTRYQ